MTVKLENKFNRMLFEELVILSVLGGLTLLERQEETDASYTNVKFVNGDNSKKYIFIDQHDNLVVRILDRIDYTYKKYTFSKFFDDAYHLVEYKKQNIHHTTYKYVECNIGYEKMRKLIFTMFNL